jgi:predicted permease
MLDALIRDLRFAARGMRRNPGFTAVAVVTLALGIGATTAVFSVVYGVLFRPLPFPAAGRLVQVIQHVNPPQPGREPFRAGLAPNQFLDLQEHSATLEAVGRYSPVSSTLSGRGDAVRLTGAAITPSFFRGLGVTPRLGRALADDDAVPGADPVVVLSHRTWRSYFGEDTTVLDSRITLGDTPRRVIGVMPDGFGFPSTAGSLMTRNSAGELNDAPEFWIPMPLLRRAPLRTSGSLFPAFAVLRPGVARERAEADVRSSAGPPFTGYRSTFELVGAREEITRDAARPLLIFQAGVTLVLLIACVNVVNLLLARSTYRGGELAIRAALGASRSRLVREGVTEALLLAGAGGTLGCLIAYGLVSALRTLPPNVLPRFQEIQVDAPSLSFAVAVSVVAGLAVGLFSGLRVARSTVWLGTRRAARTTAPRTRPSRVLVVVELAAAIVLVTAAGLLTSSFVRLMMHDPGYEPDGLFTFRISLPSARYAAPEAQLRVYDALDSQLRRVSGVESIGATNYLTSTNFAFWETSVNGRRIGEAEFSFRTAAPGYFETLRLPIVRGRSLRDEDTRSAAPGVVVSESFARKYLGNGDPIGTRLAFDESPDRSSYTVVGVAGDTAHTPEGDDPPEAIYFPASAADPLLQLVMVVRGGSAGMLIPAARSALRDIDRELAIYDARTVNDVLNQSAASPRLYASVGIFCSVVALALATIGLYGLLAYAVGLRTREFGIRMALGADSRAIIRGVLAEGLGLSGTGLAVGVVGSLAVARLFETVFVGVTPDDTGTLAVALLIFLGASVLASYVPSRRATRVDPAVALRAE